MANSLLTRSPSTLSASRPKAVRDPLIRPGSKVLFDFADPRCHPNGVITPGVAAVGTTFYSLDETAVPAVVQGGNGGTVTVNADGGLAFSGNGGAMGGLRVGSNKQFDMSAAEYERLMWIWLKLPAVGYTTTDYQPIMAMTPTNNNKSQGTLDLGIGGRKPRFSVALPDGTNSITTIAGGDISLGVPHQIAGRFDPGQPLTSYLDGAPLQAWASNQSDLYPPAGAEEMYLRVTNSVASTVYRFGLCDIDASSAAETGYGYEAAEILSAGQMIARDYQFATGARASAPKTPFA